MAGPELHDAILALFHAAALPPRIVAESPADMLVTLAMVAAGLGTSFVPAAVARNLSVVGLRFHPLPKGISPPTWPIALAHMPLAATSPAARLIAALRHDQRPPPLAGQSPPASLAP